MAFDFLGEWMQGLMAIETQSQVRLLASVLLILLLIGLRRLALQIVYRQVEDVEAHYRWKKASGYITLAIGAALIGPLWLAGVQSLTTLLGLTSAGVAIALSDPLTNLAGWVFIVLRRPFTLGDRIQTDTYRGDVIDIHLFQFTIMEIGNWVDADQSTGRVIHIPNRRVFSDPLANYTSGFAYIWNEIPVTITFESDWQRARDILGEVVNRQCIEVVEDAAQQVRRASDDYLIRYSVLTPIIYTRVVESGVRLTIRYLCDPRKRRITEHAIWEDVLASFAGEPAIRFAYPTTRFYPLEGGSPGRREAADRPVAG